MVVNREKQELGGPHLHGLCSMRGRFLARTTGLTNGNVLLCRSQYRAADDLLPAVMEKTDLEELRGLEGAGANAYFSVFDDMILRDKENFFCRGRNRRPSLDNVNAMLSFASSLLTNDCASALESVGLVPYVQALLLARYLRDDLEDCPPFIWKGGSTMMYLITYDVNTEDAAGRKHLRHIAKQCVNYGQRMQDSVFECIVDAAQCRQLQHKLRTIVDEEKRQSAVLLFGKQNRNPS